MTESKAAADIDIWVLDKGLFFTSNFPANDDTGENGKEACRD